jgi:hypothetical protein
MWEPIMDRDGTLNEILTDDNAKYELHIYKPRAEKPKDE